MNIPKQKALIVGYGSIGKRHKLVLEQLGMRVAVVTKQTPTEVPYYASCEKALGDNEFDYIVVANETYKHRQTIDILGELNFDGGVLVEKPLFDSVSPITDYCFRFLCVGYQLRFHPLLARLRRELADQQLVNYTSYVGQYLPDWRPGTDYKQSYSAKKLQGGGALADLSHELDFALWTLGGWRAATARGGHFSDLEISSDDCFSLLVETPRCPVVCLQVSYMDRRPRRDLTVNTTTSTYHVDLLQGTFSRNSESWTVDLDRNDPYLAMHETIISGGRSGEHDAAPCSYAEGVEVMKLIEAARKSAISYEWTLK